MEHLVRFWVWSQTAFFTLGAVVLALEFVERSLRVGRWGLLHRSVALSIARREREEKNLAAAEDNHVD